jgi:hypothetical protein
MGALSSLARYASAMLRLSPVDPDLTRRAIEAYAGQAAASLDLVGRADTAYDDRMLALLDVYMYATLMLVDRASRQDRIAFAEAEMKAWSVAGAFAGAAAALDAGDRDTVTAARIAIEAVLGEDVQGLHRLLR